MQSTQGAQSWLGLLGALPDSDESNIEAPERARADHGRDARRELTRLHVEIEQLVRTQGESPRTVLDSALESVTRLQIITANMDACRPPAASVAGSALVALADSHLRGHSDAIERGMAYTADNQLRLLLCEK